MDMLISTDWLVRHLHDDDLVVIDCSVHTEEGETGFRNLSAAKDHAFRHIPGARYADLTGALSDPSGVEFTPPAPEAFCAEMGRLGVGDDSRVVLYDDSNMAWAARVWWMLHWVGFDRAAVLDGGLAAWIEEGRPVSDVVSEVTPRRLTPRPRTEVIVDRDEVLAAVDAPDIRLIDTLPREFYSGDIAVYERPGHIKGAVSIPAMEMLDESGRFRDERELEALFSVQKDRRAITYCGGGILASLSAFAMKRLGYEDVAVYTASLQEWAADPDYPMTT